MAIELASGYVTLSVKYGDAMEGVKKQFADTQKEAKKAGDQSGKAFTKGLVTQVDRNGKITGVLTKDYKRAETQSASSGRRAGQRYSSGFRSATGGFTSHMTSLWRKIDATGTSAAKNTGKKTATAFGTAFKGTMAALGVTGVIASVVGGFKTVADAGMTYERSMNTMQGVTRATAAEMQKVRDQARALGADTNLAGVSAQDAGNAMAGLAKAGFSVDEAIAASRGTLQLATAAQISAADAADIQAAAMNAFQIDQSRATEVADLFANAAVNSQATMMDMGMAFKQGGSAAAGFGMDIEETMTALTMFGKMGIVGSDAGTMLRTSLTHLANPSEEASNAMADLGLQIHDANGQFVGYESMMKQVMAASENMTDAAFQEATATLFGTDAFRAAMIAKQGGPKMWDESAEAMRHEGAAAELAAAQMQGLPGVMEGLRNTFDGFKLAVFGALDSPLQALGNTVQALVSGDTANLPGWMKTIGDIFTKVGAVISEQLGPSFKAFIENVKSAAGPAIKSFMDMAKALWPILKVVGIVIGAVVVLALKGLMAIIPPLIKAFGFLFNVLKVAANIITTVFKAAWNVIKALGKIIVTAMQPGIAIFKAIGAVVGYVWKQFLQPVFSNWKILIGAVGEAWEWFYNSVIQPVWEKIKSAFSAAWEFIEPIFEKVKDAFKSVAEFVKTAWNGLANTIKGVFNKVVDVMRGPIHKLGDLLKAAGNRMQNLPLGLKIPGGGAVQDLGEALLRFRTGGLVRGPGGTDNVLAMLTSGEGVVTKSAMMRGGAPLVAALNAGWVPPTALLKAMLPGFAEGLNPGADWLRSFIMRSWGISNIGGRRADALPEHPSGNAIDVMIPNYQTEEGLALGNEIAGWILENAKTLGLTHLIWQQRIFKPGSLTGEEMGDKGSDTQNHLDHIHVWLQEGGGALPSVSGLSSFSGSLTGGVFSGGSTSLGGGGGGTAAQQRQLRDMKQRLGRMNEDLDILERELADMESSGAKDTALERKRNTIERKIEDIGDLEDDIAALEQKMSETDLGGSDSGSSNPYRKIAEGISEILPDFEGLADIFTGGLQENLPEGFSNPFEWKSTKSLAGILGFVSGLIPDPGARAALGAVASGLTGSGSGIVGAIKTLIPEPFGSMPSVFPGEEGSGVDVGPSGILPGGQHFTGTPGVPAAPGPGGTVNNDYSIAAGGQVNQSPSQLRDNQRRTERESERKYPVR